MDVDRERIVAFRVVAHNLGERLPAGSIEASASVAGVRSSQGTPLTALHARVADLDQQVLDDSITRKALVQALSVRTGAVLVPSEDLGVFTLGALPRGEESLRAALEPFFASSSPGMSAEEALQRACDVAFDALGAGPMSRPELARVMTERLPRALSPPCRGRCPDPHVEEILFRLVGVSGLWCFDQEGAIVRTDLLLNRFPDNKRRPTFRAELVRRYLRCHGPSTAAQLAEWMGVSRTDAQRSLTELCSDAVEVQVGPRKSGWILAEGVSRLAHASTPRSVRLLPPNDPYLEGRDRAVTLPDRTAQRKLWRATSSPGAVLAGGDIVATWRVRKKGRRLEITMAPFVTLPSKLRSVIGEEAQTLAVARDCASADVATT